MTTALKQAAGLHDLTFKASNSTYEFCNVQKSFKAAATAFRPAGPVPDVMLFSCTELNSCQVAHSM